jgi:hypothetical protein
VLLILILEFSLFCSFSTINNTQQPSRKRNTMFILQIEHPVPNFEGWKQAFDSDPVGRQQAGVRRYRILRPIDDPNFAMIELEFDSVGEAEALLAALRNVWSRVEGTIMENPRYRIIEVVESKEY